MEGELCFLEVPKVMRCMPKALEGVSYVLKPLEMIHCVLELLEVAFCGLEVVDILLFAGGCA